MKTSEIRQAFLDYFSKRDHQIVPSSSLIPSHDPSILFTNAGMVQFKDTFLGHEVRPYQRAVSSQLCLRAGGKHNDLENVGFTARHHTLFEMLGNFSFGDYFKREAIQFAWEFLTQILQLPPERLWITVYQDDDEAANIWLNEIKVSKSRFSRCGEKDNFWSMGDTGPCGPCSEIFYDHGPKIAGGPPGSAESEGDRYVEIWNLVFMQFNRDKEGNLTPLPKPSVDTGMGIERIAAVMQGVQNNYHIDIFQHLIKAIVKLSPHLDKEHPSLKVIADHVRAISFLIAEGVMPSNEGRGYVLRRIIRRAARHGKKIGLESPFLCHLVQPLIDVMGEAYPILRRYEGLIEQTVSHEERVFGDTLLHGLALLQQEIHALKGSELSGELAFKLYDTYGFPIDLTADVAREYHLTLNEKEFERCMEKQRQQSIASNRFQQDYQLSSMLTESSCFHGYETIKMQARILAMVVENQKGLELHSGKKAIIILDETPFYAESGGQVGDIGLIQTENAVFRVDDTQKQGDAILHQGELISGTLAVNQSVIAEVSHLHREAVRLNHSATHLLHAALKRVLGEKVEFWLALCEFFSIDFQTPPQQIFKPGAFIWQAEWFLGARFNAARWMLSRQDAQKALLCISEYKEPTIISYSMLKAQVEACARGLQNLNIKVGDRVAGVLPNNEYAVIAMLATVAIGAIWSSCSPEFGASALVDRLKQIEPSVLFISDAHCYHGKTFKNEEKIKQLQQSLHSLKQIIICPMNTPSALMPQTIPWEAFLIFGHSFEYQAFPFSHPLYILFSSGTTGLPKCIVHGAGPTLLQHLKELGLHTDLKRDENLFFYTTCSWMMWNWMVSGLMLGATLTLYDGSPTYPSHERLFQLIDKEKIQVFGTSAKFISSIEKSSFIPKNHYDLDTLRCILSTGSPLLPAHYDFVYQSIKEDVALCSISGGTDIISCFALGNPISPIYRGELQCIGLGMNVEIYDDAGQSVVGEMGELVCTKPFLAMPLGFWQDESRFYQTYFSRFPNVWTHGDYAMLTNHGGLVIYGRSDTVLNPGGVRIGTAEIYRQIETIPEILDSVVVGQNWHDDVRIILFVVLTPGLQLDEAFINKIRCTIRSNTSPRHVPAKILQVEDIPRTMNGKIVETSVRQIVNGQKATNLHVLANPESLKQFESLAQLMDD